MGAFDWARCHSRAQFAWRDSARPIEAALDGAQPDNFIQRFVVNGSLQDAQAVARNAGGRDAIRQAIVGHLKEKALNSQADETAKFSQSAYNKELNKIGDRKLGLFFSPEELEGLHATGRVASYMQVQPVGSAVNNSNSGALMLGRGADFLKMALPKTPVIGPMVIDPLRGLQVNMSQRRAQDIYGGLLMPQERIPLSQGLLGPGVGLGGLLAAPPSVP